MCSTTGKLHKHGILYMNMIGHPKHVQKCLDLGVRRGGCLGWHALRAQRGGCSHAGFDDNVRTIIFTGRPLRVRKNPYIMNWEGNRQNGIKELTGKGIIPAEHDLEKMGDDIDDETTDNARPCLMGKAVNERKSAKDIVDEFVTDAVKWLQIGNGYITSKPRLGKMV